MRTNFFLFFFFYSLVLPSQETSPEFDADYAAALQARLNASASQKGISAAVLVPGQGIWVGTRGLADNNTPVTPDMRFGIASNTKALTAALMIALEAEGLLQLDDPIGDYLPDYDPIDPAITIRELLTHTSGLFDFINDWSTATQNEYATNPNKIWSFEELIETVGTSFIEPGERYDYSNTNYLLAGKIAVEVTGTPIHELFQSRIFEPLDLEMAYPPADNIFAAPYANRWNGSSFTLTENNSNGFLSYPSTAGAIWSTAYDMVRWYDALFTGKLFSEAAQYNMLDNDGHIPYAMGLRLETAFGHSFYYHGGAWGFRSYMLYNIETGISLCILSNDQSGAWVGNLAFDLFEEVIDQMPVASYDIALRSLQPRGNLCVLDSAVQIEVKNVGAAPIESLELVYELDTNQKDSFLVNLPTPLAPQEEITLHFDLPSVSTSEKHRFRVRLKLAQNEIYLADNTDFTDFYFTGGESQSLPFLEDMEQTDNFPEQLISLHPNSLLDWKRTTFVAETGEQSLARNNYVDQLTLADYPFELPMLFIDSEGSTLEFSYAHTNVNNFQRDDLRVLISNDCGASFQTLMSLIDNAFVTAPLTGNIFQPEATHWEYATISLQDYVGQEVIIRFVLGNDYGNVAYLDNIAVRSNLVATDEVQVSDPLLNVAPNPAVDQSLLSWPSPTKVDQISVLNTYGQTLLSCQLSGETSYLLQRGDWPAGHYIIILYDQGTIVGRTSLIYAD